MSSAPADTVVSVRVMGNVTVDSDLVKRGFGLQVGFRYSSDAVRRGIRRLYDLGFFTDIAVEAESSPEGIALTLKVVENPRVGGVEYSGLHHFKEGKKLEEITGPVVGRLADDRLLAQLERRLRRAYERDGYTRARIKPRYLPGDSETRRILFVEVDEGPKMRVEAIRFVGLHRLDPGTLRHAMSQGTTGFLRKGIYKPSAVEQDTKAIEAKMATLGYRDGRVVSIEAKAGSRDDRLVLEVTIEEGPRYYVGTVRWEGNEVLAAPLLYAVTRVKSGQVYNQENIEKSQEDVYSLYAERGYIYLSIRPDYAVADSTVDVTFHVFEGKPSHVHDIIITGNTRTKERVIRRQLAIRPGDLFRRNALIRSQRELQQLGFFSDLQLNSKPVPDSNDIDLVLHVAERQVGTASAGFGFSSSLGLTGFMELGHSNLFGNGQSLNIRMERGGRRNNAEVSFTEPWFLGTPTTVGADFFNTNRIFRGPAIDLEVRRVGGALRLGRPLPMDYTRMFATYRLENQSVVDETASSVSDSTARSSDVFVTGFRLDQEDALTSSLTLRLVRNSTDDPLYPTVGSISTLSGEFSGGPMGGDQVFQKYEFDHKRYLPTVKWGGWKPTLMLRGRVGIVGEAFRGGRLGDGTFTLEDGIPQGAVADSVRFPYGGAVPIPVPRHFMEFRPETNEFFRMGGTTFDPLRGYDDFEIVPEENIASRFVVTRNVVIDTTGASPDTSNTYSVNQSAVYFPGGRYLFAFTSEWQFPVADPLHGLLFFDVGGTWNDIADFRFDSLHRSVGVGMRMQVPLLGLIGFDYGYGFDRLNRRTGRYDAQGWQPHIQFGRIF